MEIYEQACQEKEVLFHTSIHPTSAVQESRRVVSGKRRAGKGFPEVAFSPTARSPASPQRRPEAASVSGRAGRARGSLFLFRARREDHRDVAPSAVLEKPEWQECSRLHLSGAELWLAQKRGELARGWTASRGVECRTCAAGCRARGRPIGSARVRSVPPQPWAAAGLARRALASREGGLGHGGCGPGDRGPLQPCTRAATGTARTGPGAPGECGAGATKLARLCPGL